MVLLIFFLVAERIDIALERDKIIDLFLNLCGGFLLCVFARVCVRRPSIIRKKIINLDFSLQIESDVRLGQYSILRKKKNC